MNKSGTGIGSASMALIFAVLCLGIFALISYTAAGNDRALADAEAELVRGYYEADTLAELIAADILAAQKVPENARGVDIYSGWDNDMNAQTAEFSCPVSGRKELYVKLIIGENSYDILTWRLRDTEKWLVSENLTVWSGK